MLQGIGKHLVSISVPSISPNSCSAIPSKHGKLRQEGFHVDKTEPYPQLGRETNPAGWLSFALFNPESRRSRSRSRNPVSAKVDDVAGSRTQLPLLGLTTMLNEAPLRGVQAG